MTEWSSHRSGDVCWLFATSQPLTSTQVAHVNQRLTQFVTEWTAHGGAVHAQFSWSHERLLIVSADQSHQEVTGCSRDALFHFMKELSADIGIDFLDRLWLLIRRSGVEEILWTRWHDVDAMLRDGRLSQTDEYLDLTIMTLEELRTSGWKKLHETFVTA